MQRLSGLKNTSVRQRNSKKTAEKNQEELLLSLVSTAQKTLFGREHGFENIRSVKEFQENVPVADYEDLKPYIERVKKDRLIFYGQKRLNILPKLQELPPVPNIFLFLRKECLFRLPEPKVHYFIISVKKTMQISSTGK